MHTIIHKHILAQGIKRLDITVPSIASRVLPGQFVMIAPTATSKSIPMTIVDWDERKGSISVIVHEVGPTTKALGNLSISESVFSIVGPLGKPAVIDKYGLVVAVATGIGAAQILPLCRALKKKGNKVIGIIGAHSKSVLMLESQMRVVCDDLFITTNDGSYERKGLATQVLNELFAKMKIQAVYAIGGVEMMKTASGLARSHGVPAWVTINTYMTNGLGVCGSCRIRVEGGVQFACVDGPQFDGTKIDFNDLALRMNAQENLWTKTSTASNHPPSALATYVKSLWGWSKK